MKREHSVDDGIYPIFYAPLTEDDLTDHVSGNSFTGISTTIAWDSSEQMYKFYKSGTGAAVCSGLNLGLPFTSSSYSDVDATLLFDVKLNSTTVSSGNACFASLA